MSTLSSPTSAVEHSARDANMARMAKSLQRQNDWTLRRLNAGMVWAAPRLASATAMSMGIPFNAQ